MGLRHQEAKHIHFPYGFSAVIVFSLFRDSNYQIQDKSPPQTFQKVEPELAERARPPKTAPEIASRAPTGFRECSKRGSQEAETTSQPQGTHPCNLGTAHTPRVALQRIPKDQDAPKSAQSEEEEEEASGLALGLLVPQVRGIGRVRGWAMSSPLGD